MQEIRLRLVHIKFYAQSTADTTVIDTLCLPSTGKIDI